MRVYFCLQERSESGYPLTSKVWNFCAALVYMRDQNNKISKKKILQEVGDVASIIFRDFWILKISHHKYCKSDEHLFHTDFYNKDSKMKHSKPGTTNLRISN